MIEHKSYQIEDLRKIITSSNVRITAEEIGRTYFACGTIRKRYTDWLKGHPETAGMAPMFEQLKSEGVTLFSNGRGRRMGSSYPRSSVMDITTETNASGELPEASTRDPFTEFDILLSQFNKRAKVLVYQMVEDVYAEHVRKEYVRLQRQALDGKNIKALQKRILKGGNV